MSNGAPPDGQGTAIVLSYFMDELNPIVTSLCTFAEEVAGYRVGIVDSLTRKNLKSLEKRYAEYMSSFMRVYKKWHLPDEMFKGMQIQENTNLLAAYMQLKPSLTEHINVGFRVLAFIDKLLSGARSAADTQVAVILSLIAITISIVTAIFQV